MMGYGMTQFYSSWFAFDCTNYYGAEHYGGCGIQNKVLEAMALGTPVVVAAQAAEALSARPGRDLLTAETAQEFAQAALRLMDDAELRAALSSDGRAYVEQHHDWSLVTDKLVDVYQRAIDTHTRQNFQVSRKGGN